MDKVMDYDTAEQYVRGKHAWRCEFWAQDGNIVRLFHNGTSIRLDRVELFETFGGELETRVALRLLFGGRHLRRVRSERALPCGNADRSQQDEQCGTHWSHEMFVQRHETNVESRICLGILLLETAADRRYL